MKRIIVAALVTASSTAMAAPKPMVFRRFYSSPEQHLRVVTALTTYTLTRDGDTATLDVRFEVPDKANTWKLDRNETLTGTTHAMKGGIRLELEASGDHLTYECSAMKVLVAGATAKREHVPGGEGTRLGRWSPSTTTRSQALVCKRTDVGSSHYLDVELVFASRPIEHVEADDSCCVHPGDSLRWLPNDRSVVAASR